MASVMVRETLANQIVKLTVMKVSVIEICRYCNAAILHMYIHRWFFRTIL